MAQRKQAKLDVNCRGPNVEVARGLEAGQMVRGSGTVLCNTSVQQDRAYFEVTLVEAGGFSIGCGQQKALRGKEDFQGGALDNQLGAATDASWGHAFKAGELEPGTVVGVTYDQLVGPTPELKYFINTIWGQRNINPVSLVQN